MTAPQRIQLRRAAGWRLQDKSHALNGLPAKSVARPHAWANPYVIGRDGDRAECLARYAQTLLPHTHRSHGAGDAFKDLQRRNVQAAVLELGGHNLACWCLLSVDCHADLLLRVANDPSAYLGA